MVPQDGLSTCGIIQECGAEISYRGLVARYCETCYAEVNKRRQQEAYLATRTVIERACADCQADITERATQHPLATRCGVCQAKHRSARKPRKVRSCPSCGADVSGTGRKYCDACRVPRLRTCRDCEAEVGKGKLLCGEHAEIRKQQARERRLAVQVNREAHNEQVR
jgi:hypothetical protein